MGSLTQGESVTFSPGELGIISLALERVEFTIIPMNERRLKLTARKKRPQPGNLGEKHAEYWYPRENPGYSDLKSLRNAGGRCATETNSDVQPVPSISPRDPTWVNSLYCLTDEAFGKVALQPIERRKEEGALNHKEGWPERINAVHERDFLI